MVDLGGAGVTPLTEPGPSGLEEGLAGLASSSSTGVSGVEDSGLYDRAVDVVEDVSCRRWRSSPNDGPRVDAAGLPTGSGWDPGVGNGAGGGGGL